MPTIRYGAICLVQGCECIVKMASLGSDPTQSAHSAAVVRYYGSETRVLDQDPEAEDMEEVVDEINRVRARQQ